jgi:2'-5' RNA ligase
MAVDRLMAAIPITEVAAGQRVDAWPPHITLVPWFELPSEKWGDFDHEMHEREIVWDLDARMQVGKRDMFGDSHDKPVARLFGIMAVLAHTRIKALAEEFGGRVDERFTGLEWHPHITDSPGFQANVGDIIETNHIAIFQKHAGVKIIKEVYERTLPGYEATT